MEHRHTSPPAIDAAPTLILSRFRVMARLSSGQHALVCLAQTLTEAARQAEAFLESILQQARYRPRWQIDKQDRVRVIWVEQWIGTPTEGRWETLAPEVGGFRHRCDGSRRERPTQKNSSLPRSGDCVACTLLSDSHKSSSPNDSSRKQRIFRGISLL
jgi:hypothetical protein